MSIKELYLKWKILELRNSLGKSRYVLVTLSGGIIDQVTFYNDAYQAVSNLSEYVKSMDPDENDAAVYGPGGMIANAKLFMDDGDGDDGVDILRSSGNKKDGISIVANPCHSLGFLVIGETEPVGYADPLKALSVLEKMRKVYGVHIKLYRAVSVDEPALDRKKLEKFNADHGVTDFEYGLVGELLK